MPGRRRLPRRPTRLWLVVRARAARDSRQSAAPSRAVSRGPSGRTQIAVVTPKTGEMLSATAAQNPACGLATTQPIRQTRNCDTGEQQDEGEADRDRRLGSQQMGGGPGEPPTGRRMVEIAETQRASGCHHIALVDARDRLSRRRPAGSGLSRRSIGRLGAGRLGKASWSAAASVACRPSRRWR